MRRDILVVWIVTVAALAGSVAHADVNLGGGVFIAHYVSELTFSEAPSAEEACAAYFDYAITNADQ
ncbi:MAG: hypothetical protein KAY24_19445, partial [Candidatus Eisenbacteria sp.]|nr:hypothetical protein [Candidatus Eisenbacteria bacterium]